MSKSGWVYGNKKKKNRDGADCREMKGDVAINGRVTVTADVAVAGG